MKIDVGKTYLTKSGITVKIVAVNDIYKEFPYIGIAGWDVLYYNSIGIELNSKSFAQDGHNIQKIVTTYGPFGIDDPVFISGENVFGHFAGTDEEGNPLVFIDGRTSWTTNKTRVVGTICRAKT